MPSADRANGALCHERKWTVCSPQPIRCNPTVQSEDVFVRSAFSAPMTSSLSALHRKGVAGTTDQREIRDLAACDADVPEGALWQILRRHDMCMPIAFLEWAQRPSTPRTRT